MEIWKDIEGYEGLYQVSNLGRVKSLPKWGAKGGIMRPSHNKKGYLQICLTKDKIKTMFLVHRLVAFAFPDICGKWFEGAEINHKNMRRDDNRAENLEWISHAANIVFSQGITVRQYNSKWKLVGEYSSLSEAAQKTGCCQGNITLCRQGKQKMHKGFYWV